MTDARPKRARVPQASTAAAGASVLFLGVLGAIGVQMARGHDPALGAWRPKVAAAPPVARRVVERRIVRRVVVTKVITDPVAAAVVPAPSAVVPVQSFSAAPVAAAPVVRSTPPPVAAPAPAPAPAPPPAPVQTRSS
jgi:hypothetical protein